VNQQDRRGNTPLLMAARNGDVETLRLLLAHGADPHARLTTDAPFEGGANALALAGSSGNADAVKLLLARGVRVDANGQALLFAVMNGSLDMAMQLLAAGATVNVADPAGYTPLIHATLTENENLALLDLLLARGADPRAKARDGSTALDLARRKGWTRAIARLQQAGAVE
jgi:uncharacterized protein